jgi:hypothetical protein
MKVDSKSESELPRTGEGYIPQIGGEIEPEHVHRYFGRPRVCQGKRRVGYCVREGFGSAIPANSARSVFGLDIAAEAVEHAATRYRLDNVRFKQGSCAEISLDMIASTSL